MKLGAEPKKVAIFVALLAVAGIAYWVSSSSDTPTPVVARTAVDPVAAVSSPMAAGPVRSAARRDVYGHDSIGDANFKLEPVDPTKIDPTLRLDLLSKVQSVPEEGGQRFIFQIGLAPEVLQAAQERDKKAAAIPKVDPLHPNGPAEKASIQAPPPPSGPPPAPPINLKYYGYSTKRSDGEKKAFFLDGDDIIVGAEGEIIDKHYKIVRIGVSSVQMEDTASKSTQTLPLQQDAAPA